MYTKVLIFCVSFQFISILFSILSTLGTCPSRRGAGTLAQGALTERTLAILEHLMRGGLTRVQVGIAAQPARAHLLVGSAHANSPSMWTLIIARRISITGFSTLAGSALDDAPAHTPTGAAGSSALHRHRFRRWPAATVRAQRLPRSQRGHGGDVRHDLDIVWPQPDEREAGCHFGRFVVGPVVDSCGALDDGEAGCRDRQTPVVAGARPRVGCAHG